MKATPDNADALNSVCRWWAVVSAGWIDAAQLLKESERTVGISTHVMVQDPVDPYELFAAARSAVGLPGDAAWSLFDIDNIHLLRARSDQGARALVSVHFAPEGGPYPSEDEVGEPDGYALVSLSSTAGDSATDRADHEQIVTVLGQWLSEHGQRWSWQYGEDEVWVAGHFLRPATS
ncbi:hypothetical protein [Nocardia sp. NPDC003963]